MVDFSAIAGQKIFIGTKLSAERTDFTAADFSTLTWIEIDGWAEKGEQGDEYELIEETLINRGRTAKMKGTANGGSMENVFVRLDDDPGQIAFRAASRTRDEYAFRIDGNRPGPTDKVAVKYFTGLPMSVRGEGGDANTADRVVFSIEVTSNTVDVAAA